MEILTLVVVSVVVVAAWIAGTKYAKTLSGNASNAAEDVGAGSLRVKEIMAALDAQHEETEQLTKQLLFDVDVLQRKGLETQVAAEKAIAKSDRAIEELAGAIESIERTPERLVQAGFLHLESNLAAGPYAATYVPSSGAINRGFVSTWKIQDTSTTLYTNIDATDWLSDPRVSYSFSEPSSVYLSYRIGKGDPRRSKPTRKRGAKELDWADDALEAALERSA